MESVKTAILSLMTSDGKGQVYIKAISEMDRNKSKKSLCTTVAYFSFLRSYVHKTDKGKLLAEP